MIEVVYIGRKFYLESGTTMSSLYWRKDNDRYERLSWGEVEEFVSGGEVVTIRPATGLEMMWAEAKLEAIKR